jgi:fructose/tagatose bisphosphate aldolase
LTAGTVRYYSARAREISAAVGKILCLHGTSSVKTEDLSKLPVDGFVKINIYTVLAVLGGQAVARNVLNNLGNIFTEQELKDLVQKGVLGKNTLASDYGETIVPIKPKLQYVANPSRRDVWFQMVTKKCREFLEIFNYRHYAQ